MKFAGGKGKFDRVGKTGISRRDENSWGLQFVKMENLSENNEKLKFFIKN